VSGDNVSVALIVSVTAHERGLRELPCAVSGRDRVSLHHCHGGSMKLLGWHVGMGQKQNPFLQIPLAPELHYIGPDAIDGGIGVESWERKYGTQVEHLGWVAEQLGYDIFALARAWGEKYRAKTSTGQGGPASTD
jgi:hypothetical protein